MLSFIKFGEGNRGIIVDKGLLVDGTHSLDVSNIVSILRLKISRVFSFNLPKGFSLLLVVADYTFTLSRVQEHVFAPFLRGQNCSIAIFEIFRLAIQSFGRFRFQSP